MVEMIGVPIDSIAFQTSSWTSTIDSPNWEEPFDFSVTVPELAFIRLVVRYELVVFRDHRLTFAQERVWEIKQDHRREHLSILGY